MNALRLYGAAVAATSALALAAPPEVRPDDRAERPSATHRLAANPSGFAFTVSTHGFIDTDNPFFQSLGTNQRSCSTCHRQDQGWTITPAGVQQRFDRTQGTDPIFRTVDGSNSPAADVSTLAARLQAYSMLLGKGLIRVGLAIPSGAEFELVQADDPYHYASAKELSLFRRPLPTTNLKFLSTVMWDGRETFRDASSTDCLAGTTTCFASVRFDLLDQSNIATLGHAQANAALTSEQRAAIVGFATSLYTAQVYDRAAGWLELSGARGGPIHTLLQPFHFGINDALAGDYRTHAAFNPNAMTLFDAWANPSAGRHDDWRIIDARRAVARGQALFNAKPIQITQVAGLNDDLSLPVIAGTCTTCHDSPNAGSHSVPAPLNIGLADASRRTPDMPLYTLRNLATAAVVQTTDPGRALVTGKWKDIGRFKGPVLRAVATRAPYFHNGLAKDLQAVVDFYDTRFSIGLTAAEKADLIAFLQSL